MAGRIEILETANDLRMEAAELLRRAAAATDPLIAESLKARAEALLARAERLDPREQQD
jgi:hypothetical protein